jgi:hypothetical protein
MKKIIIGILSISVFLSCQNNNSNLNSNNSPIDSSGISKEQILLFKKIINGVWIKKDYIDLVVEKKSPAAATDEASGITIMNISTSSIRGNGDSVMVGVGWGNHEGGDIILRFKAGKKPSTILVNERESLGYEINNRDTTLVLYQFNEENKKEYVTKYIKALNQEPADELGFGMDYLINKGLISGKYIATDSLGKKFDVTFFDNGKVTGLPNFKKYWIENDLMGEPMSNLDGIVFDLYTKKQSSYTFKINKDTLNLYNSFPNADSTLAIVGKLKYQFIRQK